MPSAPYRVLHLTTDGRLAGAERLLLWMADSFQWPRIQFLFGTLGSAGDFGEEVRRRGLPFVSLGCRRWWDVPAAVRRLRRILRNERIDVLHTHLFHANVIGQLAVGGAHHPSTILTRHYSEALYHFGNPPMQILDRWATQGVDHVIAVSEDVRAVLLEKERIPSDRITVIHNGVDLNQMGSQDSTLVEQFRVNWGLQGRVVVGAIGALHPWKGHRYFLQALARVMPQRPPLVGVVVGQGPLEEALKREARQLGIADRVIFTGYARIPSVALGAMDVVVHPSLDEGFGIAVVEALALAKPVIASRVGGLPEIIEDGISGILIPPADPEALAEAITALLADPARASRLGHAGQECVQRRFTIQEMCRRYETVYHRLLDVPETVGVAEGNGS